MDTLVQFISWSINLRIIIIFKFKNQCLWKKQDTIKQQNPKFDKPLKKWGPFKN
jgi:hypothetical protein